MALSSSLAERIEKSARAGSFQKGETRGIEGESDLFISTDISYNDRRPFDVHMVDGVHVYLYKVFKV